MNEVRERFVAMLMQDPELYGLAEVRFIHTPQIFTHSSVRLRCQYSCLHARQTDYSPPVTPSARETRELLDEYKYGLMMRREELPDQRPAGELWHDFSRSVLGIEQECFARGYHRAFAAAIGNCLYLHANDAFRPCEFPYKARPTLEAIGVDLHDTFDMIQWQHLLQRTDDGPLHLFALMLLE